MYNYTWASLHRFQKTFPINTKIGHCLAGCILDFGVWHLQELSFHGNQFSVFTLRIVGIFWQWRDRKGMNILSSFEIEHIKHHLLHSENKILLFIEILCWSMAVSQRISKRNTTLSKHSNDVSSTMSTHYPLNIEQQKLHYIPTQ